MRGIVAPCLADKRRIGASPDISPSRLLNRQISFSSNRLIPYFESPAGVSVRSSRDGANTGARHFPPSRGICTRSARICCLGDQSHGTTERLPAGYKLRWPRPRTVGSGHGRSRRRRPWGTFARVRAHGRYTIRRGYASVSSLARGAPSRCCLLARRAPSRCCLLARGAPSRSPAEGSEHPHAGKILRDHRGP